MYKLIDGKVISKQIKDELKEKVAAIKAEGTEICLAVIQAMIQLRQYMWAIRRKLVSI